MSKPPITLEEFKKIVKAIKEEDEYVTKCIGLDFNIYENLHCMDALIDLVDHIFTPKGEENYESFSWWCFETEFGKLKDMARYWDEDKKEHKVETVEQCYKMLCEQLED